MIRSVHLPATTPRGRRRGSSNRQATQGLHDLGSSLTSPSQKRWQAFLAFLCVMVALRNELFFSSMQLLGGSYAGSEQSASYLIYFALSSLAMCAGTAWFIFTNKALMTRHLIILALPLILTAVYLLDSSVGRTQSTSTSHFLLALAIACPAALAGMVASQLQITRHIVPVLAGVMMLLTVAVVLSVFNGSAGSTLERGVGGATYQTTSYLGALAFNLNFYFCLFGVGDERRRSLLWRLFAGVSLPLLPVQVVGVLLSGGRGGFVLIVLGAVTQLFLAARSPQVTARRLMGAPMAIVLPMLLLGVPWLMADPSRASAVERVFAYVGQDGIDWSGTSMRDMVYAEALAMLDNAPFFGFGLFSWGIDYYPHNFVLELMLNGGIVYAFVWLAGLMLLAARAISAIRRNREIAVIVPLALYPLVMLQFSGSYMITGPFWFVMAFALCVKRTITGVCSRPVGR